MESLRYDVEPYNIHTTVVEPGYFRTELLVDGSVTWPELSIDDYAKLARALLAIADQHKPLQRFVAGAPTTPVMVAYNRVKGVKSL
jgi:NAD(P)-dependent dehydrogenase (short-subunit alcohol dehydrogenase family)